LNFEDASNYIYKAESSHLNDLTFHNLIAYRDIRLKNTLKDAVEIIPKGHKISI